MFKEKHKNPFSPYKKSKHNRQKSVFIRRIRSFTQCFILFIDSPVADSIFRTKALLSVVSCNNVLFYNIGISLYMQIKYI